jgi:hypothetical protein
MENKAQRLLRNRAWLLGALAFCAYCALSPWLRTRSSPSAERDLWGTIQLFFFFPFAIFIGACIAVRSKFVGDRVVFGVTAGSIAVNLAERAFSLGPAIEVIIRRVETIAWAGAALVCLALLVPGSRPRDNL